MNRSAQGAAVLALVSLWACSPAPRSNSPPTHATPAAAPRTALPTAPPKRYKMVCRNSQTGAAAACGTPGAVMVGIKPE